MKVDEILGSVFDVTDVSIRPGDLQVEGGIGTGLGGALRRRGTASTYWVVVGDGLRVKLSDVGRLSRMSSNSDLLST